MKKHTTAFYVETVILFLVFVGVLLVLIQVFGKAQATSRKARELTQAVDLAQEGAEALAASADPIGLIGLLDGELVDHEVTVCREDLTMKIYLTEDENLLRAHIEVLAERETIYSLDTAVARKEAVP